MKAFNGKNFKDGVDASSVGIEMALSIVFGYLLGAWIDKSLETAPWATIIMLLCGIFAAFRAVYRVTKKTQARLDSAAKREREELRA